MRYVKTESFNQDNIIHHGNKFIQGHLNLGYRGTLDEFRKDELVAVNIPLIYDQFDDKWRESINVFNPFYTTVRVNQIELNVLKLEAKYHLQSICLDDALHQRKTVFQVDNSDVVVQSQRFISLIGKRNMFLKYEVSVLTDTYVEIFTGIDLDIWDINGPHLNNIEVSIDDDMIRVRALTHEKKHRIEICETIDLSFDADVDFETRDQIKGRKIGFQAKKGEVYHIFKYAVIAINHDVKAAEELKKIVSEGYDHHLLKHQNIWHRMWQDSSVEIKGDKAASHALDYSIYQLLLLAPREENQSIPARGISGQTYKGAIFWDTEIFMLPFFINTNLYAAKQLINYRISTLSGAKQKAESYGFKGAFYAWESQEDGYDACTDYNVTDVFTNRLVRTYFKDKQIHISADIVYAIWQYYERTKDIELVKNGGLEVIVEVSKFFYDYAAFKLQRQSVEFWDVMGPDEYHERVHNNAFTNQMIKHVFEVLINLADVLGKEAFLNYIKVFDFEETYEQIKKIVDKIHIQEPNELGIIEQFDGYFKLHDINKEVLLKKRIHPNEYLGGYGLAGDTQIIKQADVIALLYLFKDKYNHNIMKENWQYYEPRTEHGSSLSASMYALIACQIGMPEYAYPLFMKSATVDLTGESKQYAGGIYIGGTHPAASGGAYLTAIYGFAGIYFKDNKIYAKPQLPHSFISMKFKMYHLDKQYEIFITKDKVQIKELDYGN